ncbi:hypothetical protein FI667_g13777, partial [Globisporangium splendens]
MAALRELVEKRNVRSILFQFSRATATNVFWSSEAPQVRNAHACMGVRIAAYRVLIVFSLFLLLAMLPVLQILRALKIHGFRLGYIGEQWTDEVRLRKHDSEIGSAFDFVQYGKEIGASALYSRAAESLNVPLQRTVLVTEQGIADNDAFEFRKMATAVIDISADAPDQPAQQLAKFTKDLLSIDNCLDTSERCFGPFRVRFSQIFYESPLSFALVNLKPIVPDSSICIALCLRVGHVLVIPKRCVDRFQQLDVDEVADIWYTAQDGEAAGQTVRHVHIHILPRAPADFVNNDDIYTEIEKHERSLKVDNETRTPHSEDEMALEASTLRQLFPSHLN